MTLAHWIYSREEWKKYHRRRLLKKNILRYLYQLLIPSRSGPTPEIRITAEAVVTNERAEPFHEDGRTFQRVIIREAGKMNVMEIFYELEKNTHEIQIPIPRGKLREAIKLQEELLYRHPSPPYSGDV